jgi:ribose 5-phosphate isomerase A
VTTIVERALEMVPDQGRIGLGSGRAALRFVHGLAEKIAQGLRIAACVATSLQTEAEAKKLGLPVSSLAETPTLDVAFDGADEVDPHLNLIKGYGRALVREKVVASASRKFVILVGEEKLVWRLGARGKLPVEVLPFAFSFCLRRLAELGLSPHADIRNGEPFVTDNGNNIIDCEMQPIADPVRLESELRAVPGVVGTGLFLQMADTVLVGHEPDFRLMDERTRKR